MKSATKISTLVLAVGCLILFSGCADIHQTIHMQHDGSGRITERIKILPRTLRLMKGRQARTGKSEPTYHLLSEEAVQKRLASYGAVVLKSQKRSTLADGTLQLDVEYTFSDINKVNLWLTPIFKSNNAGLTGKMRLTYNRIVPNHDNPPKYFKADQFSVKLSHLNGYRVRYSSPSILKDYERIAPMFQDMINGIKLRIDVVAPVEEFDDASMVYGFRFEKNRVTLLNIEGRNVGGAKEMIKQFIAGEVDGPGRYARGGPWQRLEDQVPNTDTPYTTRGGAHFNFLKLSETAAPAGAAKKQKKRKRGAKKSKRK